MPIESLPTYLKVEQAYQATPKQYSGSEIFAEGISSGFQENILSYLSDSGTKLSTSLNVDNQEISEEEFYRHPSYREGMKWMPGMNYDLLNQYSEHYAIQQKRQLMQENSGSYYVPFIAGNLVSGLFDPVNWLPFGAYAKGSGLVANAVRMGGANAIIELAESPLTAYAYEARGTELTPKELALNTAMAAGLGGIFASGIHSAKGITNYIRGLGYSGELPSTAIVRAADGDFTIDKTTQQMINRGNVFRFVEGAGTHVDNTNPLAGNKQFVIDTTGQIHEKIEDARTPTYAIVGFSEGLPYIKGDLKTILQILPSLKKYLPETVADVAGNKLPAIEIQSKINSDVMRFDAERLTKEQIDSWVTEKSSQFKKMFGGVGDFEPKLNQWSVLGTKEPVDKINYELEFELKNDIRGFDIEKDIGKIYKIENGKRTLLSKEEKQKVYKEVFQDRLENSGVGSQSKKIDTTKQLDTESEMKKMGGDDSEARGNLDKKHSDQVEDKLETDIKNTNNKIDTTGEGKIKDIDKEKAKAIGDNLAKKFNQSLEPYGVRIDENGTLVKVRELTNPEDIKTQENILREFKTITDAQKITKDEAITTKNCLESK